MLALLVEKKSKYGLHSVRLGVERHQDLLELERDESDYGHDHLPPATGILQYPTAIFRAQGWSSNDWRNRTGGILLKPNTQ